MRQYKANLGIINARYGEYERRLLEFFATRERFNLKTFKIAENAGGAEVIAERWTSKSAPDEVERDRHAVQRIFESGIPHIVKVPHGLEFLLSRLILDGCVVKVPLPEFGVLAADLGVLRVPLFDAYLLTEVGKDLVDRLIAAEPLDP